MALQITNPDFLFDAPDGAHTGIVLAGMTANEIRRTPDGQWVEVDIIDGPPQHGFLRSSVVKAEDPPGIEIDERLFFQFLSQLARDPAHPTNHHYLFALAYTESQIRNLPADNSGKSDAVGPFQYSAQQWTDLLQHFDASGFTSDDRFAWIDQATMAAFEASGDAQKVNDTLGRTGQYDELYIVHELGETAGLAVVKASALDRDAQLQAAIGPGVFAALSAAKPKLFAKPTVGDALDAGADALAKGFERAAVLGAELDPPEISLVPPPTDDPVPNAADFGPAGPGMLRYKQQVTAANNILSAKGWQKAPIVGILTNIYCESKFNPRIPGDGGQAYGLCQWHRDRQRNFLAKFGKSMINSNFDEQVQFIDYELRTSEKRAGSRLSGQTDPRVAAYIVSLYYERPRDKEVEANRRAGIAASFAPLVP